MGPSCTKIGNVTSCNRGLFGLQDLTGDITKIGLNDLTRDITTMHDLTRDITTMHDLTRDITTMHDLTGDITVMRLQDLGSWNGNSLTGDGCIGPNCNRRGLMDLTRDISTFHD